MTKPDGKPDQQTLAQQRADFRLGVKRHYKHWAIRWAIGFALIALAVHKFGLPAWLYLGGAVIAGISFASIHYFAQVFEINMVSAHEEKETQNDTSS